MSGAGKRRLWLYGVSVVLGAGLLFAGFGITLPPDPSTRLTGAALLAQLGDYETALSMCDETLEEHPDHLEAHVYRAMILGRAERHSEAVRAYDRALDLCTDAEMERDLLLDRASVLLALGRLDDVASARARLAASGVDYRVHLLDGLSAEKRDEWAAAVASYAGAYAERPADGVVKSLLYHARLEYGRDALAGGRFAQARDVFDEARAVLPDAPEAHLRSAEASLALEEPVAALDALRALPRANTPGVAPLAFRAATLHLQRRDAEAAFAALALAAAADANAVVELMAVEPLWDAYRNETRVRALLAKEHEVSGAGLTEEE